MFYTNFSESKPPIDFELDILSEQYNQVNDELFYYYSGLKRLFNFMIQESKEYLLQMKTKKTCLKEIYEVIKIKHSYECFEFAIFDLTSINDNYLKWIDKETK